MNIAASEIYEVVRKNMRNWIQVSEPPLITSSVAVLKLFSRQAFSKSSSRIMIREIYK